MRRRHKVEEAVAIDISPLIDMVFILLIFFMVSTTFIKDAVVGIERPAASSATPSSQKSVRVSIEQSGAIYLGEDPVKPWALQGRVAEALDVAGDKRVLVVSDRRVAAERLVEVVDQCRLAGASEVGVATSNEVR